MARQFSNVALEAYATQVFSPIAWKNYALCGFLQTYDDLRRSPQQEVAGRFVFNLIFARAQNPYYQAGEDSLLTNIDALLGSRDDLAYFCAFIQKLGHRVDPKLQQSALFSDSLTLLLHLLMLLTHSPSPKA